MLIDFYKKIVAFVFAMCAIACGSGFGLAMADAFQKNRFSSFGLSILFIFLGSVFITGIIAVVERK